MPAIDPFPNEGRPHRYGYFLLVVAAMALSVAFLAPPDKLDWYATTVLVAFSFLLTAIGLRLVLKARQNPFRMKNKGEK